MELVTQPFFMLVAAEIYITHVGQCKTGKWWHSIVSCKAFSQFSGFIFDDYHTECMWQLPSVSANSTYRGYKIREHISPLPLFTCFYFNVLWPAVVRMQSFILSESNQRTKWQLSQQVTDCSGSQAKWASFEFFLNITIISKNSLRRNDCILAPVLSVFAHVHSSSFWF